MPTTTTGVLADTIPTVIEEARFTEQYKEVLSKLCWRITKDLHDGSTVNLPYFGTVTANTLSEGVDMVSPQAMTDTSVQLTPAEVGAQILLTDKMVRDNQEDVIRAAGRILGDAMLAKREGDLADQLDDATTSMAGTGTALTLGHLAASWATLSGNALSAGGPAPKPYVVVHHPFVLLDMVDVFTPTLAQAGETGVGGGSLSDDALRNYTIGRIFGMNVYESGNISRNATPDAKGGVFAAGRGGGLVLATAKEWDIKDEPDYSRRLTELNVVGEYAVGEYLAGWIVELFNDATAPA
jgi:nucleoid DNA-binding protein